MAFTHGFEKTAINKEQYVSAVKHSPRGLERAAIYLKNADKRLVKPAVLSNPSKHSRNIVSGSTRIRAIKELKGVK